MYKAIQNNLVFKTRLMQSVIFQSTVSIYNLCVFLKRVKERML